MIPSLIRQIKFFMQHPLTRQRPVSAMGRFCAWQIQSRLRQDIEFQWIEGSKLLVRRGMHGATGNIYCGLMEFADMAFVLHILRPGDLFGDVGANIGSFTILASAVCGADVVAIEPDPDSAQRLRANIALNNCGEKVGVLETAVGDHQGFIRFTVGLDAMNKVSTAGDGLPSRQVPLTTLDSLFAQQAPVMLKMDVEGFEASVLRGADHVLAQPQLLGVLSESCEPEVIDIFARHGFKQWYYEPMTRELSLVNTVQHNNGLFLRNLPEIQARLKSAPRRQVLDRLV